MGRQPCCEKSNELRRGPWTVDEDHKLITFILNNGIQCWRLVPKLAGLMRCGKSCRLRWINYLRPDLKRGAFTEAEEDMIIQLHSRLGNKWSKIASHFPGRTDNEIKNHWNTRIKKKLKFMALDPQTHKPIDETIKMEVGIQHSTNSSSQSQTIKPELSEFTFHSRFKEEGNINIDVSSNSIDQIPGINTEMGLVMNHGMESCSTLFPVELGQGLIPQNWIDDNLFQWDVFNNNQGGEDFV